MCLQANYLVGGDAGMAKSKPSSTAQLTCSNDSLSEKYLAHKGDQSDPLVVFSLRDLARRISGASKNITEFYVANHTLNNLGCGLPQITIRDLVFILIGLTKIQPRSFRGSISRPRRGATAGTSRPNKGRRVRTGFCQNRASTSDN